VKFQDKVLSSGILWLSITEPTPRSPLLGTSFNSEKIELARIHELEDGAFDVIFCITRSGGENDETIRIHMSSEERIGWISRQ
jgi:hypothetical protein